jgi:putative spermidine/putrescine transport system substrate-binding protein
LVAQDQRAMNPADPSNAAMQAKINADWYKNNHSKTFQAYLDLISS